LPRLKSDIAQQTPSRARKPSATRQQASGQGKRAHDAGIQAESRPADPAGLTGSKRSDDEAEPVTCTIRDTSDFLKSSFA
jgi:hypothetical protein